MPEILSTPLTVKHIAPGGYVTYLSGPQMWIRSPEDAPSYIEIEVATGDVREIHGGTAFVINGAGVTIEVIEL